MIRVVTVGKKHESWVVSGIERYEKRLKKPWNINWVYVPHSQRESNTARTDESERILSRLSSDDYVVLLDERGRAYTSPEVSHLLLRSLEQAKSVVIVIGGAYGLDLSVHRRADIVWSLSPLVFPHQLVRLIAVEQLYRAQEIAAGNPYHHS